MLNQSLVSRGQVQYKQYTGMKNEIKCLKASNQWLYQQIKANQQRNKKKFIHVNQGYEQVIKLVSEFYIELNKKNLLSSNKNMKSSKIFLENQDIVRHIQEQNTKLRGMFNQQTQNVNQLIQANQIVVNEELTNLCRKQQDIINKQITQNQHLNNIIKEQVSQVKDSLLTVQSFHQRNSILQEKLSNQREQIQEYIKIVRKQSSTTITEIISSRLQETSKKYQQQFQKTIQTAEQILKNKNQISQLKSYSEQLRNQQLQLLKQSKEEQEIIKKVREEIQKKQQGLELDVKSCLNMETKFSTNHNKMQKKLIATIGKIAEEINIIELKLYQQLMLIAELYNQQQKNAGRREKIKFAIEVVGGVVSIVRQFI